MYFVVLFAPSMQEDGAGCDGCILHKKPVKYATKSIHHFIGNRSLHETSSLIRSPKVHAMYFCGRYDVNGKNDCPIIIKPAQGM